MRVWEAVEWRGGMLGLVLEKEEGAGMMPLMYFVAEKEAPRNGARRGSLSAGFVVAEAIEMLKMRSSRPV